MTDTGEDKVESGINPEWLLRENERLQEQLNSRAYDIEFSARTKALDIAIAGTAGPNQDPEARKVIEAAEANYAFIIAGILGPAKPTALELGGHEFTLEQAVVIEEYVQGRIGEFQAKRSPGYVSGEEGVFE